MAKRPKAPVIVEIRLGINSDGCIARDGPFVVIADDADRCGRYVNEPAVIAHLCRGMASSGSDEGCRIPESVALEAERVPYTREHK